MFKHILVPTDGSDLAELAVRRCMALARSVGARVTGLTVIPEFQVFTYHAELLEQTKPQYLADARSHAAKYLASVSKQAEEAGVSCDTTSVMSDRTSEAIVTAAKDLDCDLIVMSSHGRGGVASAILGSVTQKVLASSDLPVLVYRSSAAT